MTHFSFKFHTETAIQND